MDLDQYMKALTPDIVEKFKTAVEIGKWPDGRALTQEQKDTCMQAIIAYEHKYVDETERTAYVPPKEDPCATKEEDEPIKWSK